VRETNTAKAYQHGKQPGNALTRPASQQALGRSPAAPILQSAQSAYGNQAINRLLDTQFVQAKMEVTPPSDSYEQEAEHVANQVMRTTEPATLSAGTTAISRQPEPIHRAAKSEAKDDKKKPDTPKKKEDDKVKRAAAKDDQKDEKKNVCHKK
jgi:hypothetical protein